MFVKHFAVGLSVLASTCGGSSDTYTPDNPTEPYAELRLDASDGFHSDSGASELGSSYWFVDSGRYARVPAYYNTDEIRGAADFTFDAFLADDYAFDGFEYDGTVEIDLDEYPDLIVFDYEENEMEHYQDTGEGLLWARPQGGTVEITGCPFTGSFGFSARDVEMQMYRLVNGYWVDEYTTYVDADVAFPEPMVMSNTQGWAGWSEDYCW